MRIKQIASILIFALILSVFNIGVYADVEDPFEMIAGDSYDECLVAGKCTKKSGYTAMSAGTYIVFKNVNFYDAPVEIIIMNAISADTVSGNTYTVQIDSTEGTLVAEVDITKAEGWSKPVANSAAITTEIKGVHDLYVKSSKPNDFYGIQFKRAEKPDGSFREYDEERVYDDTEDLKNEYKINALANLGIVSAYEANNFVADLPMSRGDFARNVAHILADEIPVAQESVYSDVAVGDEYCDVVNFLYSKGILTLNDEKTFSPNKFIKAGDAAVMLLHLLGYRDMCSALGGYLNGYEIVAGDIGISWSGLVLTDYLKRGDAANMLYNALNAEYLAPTWEDGTTDIVYGTKKGILEKTKDIIRGEGKVTVTAFGALVGGYEGTENVCYVETDRYETDGLSVENYLGVLCEFFYKLDEDGTRTILYIAPKKNVKQLILRSSETEFSQIDESTIEYQLDSKKTKTVRIPASASWIYNNRAISQKITELVDGNNNQLVTPDDFRGTIRLVDNGNGYETVFVEQYKNIKVHSFDTEKMLLSNELEVDIYGKRKEYDLSDINLVLSNGMQIIRPTAINRGMLLEMYLSYDNKVAVLFVNESEVVGSVTKINSEYAVIDGVEYGLAKEFNETIPVGKNCVFHLNRHNEIVWFEYADDSIKIGVFSGTISGEDDSVNVKIITETGKEEIFVPEEEMRIDGRKQKDGVEAMIVTLKNIDRYTPLLYKCNADGKLIMMDSVLDGTMDKFDTLTTIRKQTDTIGSVVPTYDYVSGVGGFKATNIPGKVCWVQPATPDATLILINENYAGVSARGTYIGKLSSFSTSFGQSYGFYATDRTKTIPDIVLSVTYNQHKDMYGSVYIDEIIHMVNDNNEVGYLVKAVSANSYVEYWVSEDNMNVVDRLKLLKRGDLVRIFENMNGEFSEFRIYAFADGEKTRDSLTLHSYGVNKTDKGANGNSTISDNHVYGKVVDIDGDYVVVEPFGWTAGDYYWCKINSETMMKVSDKSVTYGNSVRSLKVGDTVMVRYAGSSFKWIAVYE